MKSAMKLHKRPNEIFIEGTGLIMKSAMKLHKRSNEKSIESAQK
jgi:hypothetical protein